MVCSFSLSFPGIYAGSRANFLIALFGRVDSELGKRLEASAEAKIA